MTSIWLACCRDVSYARGMETMWDVFMDQMENLTTQVPWMLTNGNHGEQLHPKICLIWA